ncbi:MAG: SPOR domain-containing protein, partial [Longimicrobiales bacterium]
PIGGAGVAPAAASALAAPVAEAFTVQLGAFRDASAAARLAARARRAGFDPRLVARAGSDLIHVRVGRFRTAAAAAATFRRLRESGFDTALVDDAAAETPVR